MYGNTNYYAGTYSKPLTHSNTNKPHEREKIVQKRAVLGKIINIKKSIHVHFSLALIKTKLSLSIP